MPIFNRKNKTDKAASSAAAPIAPAREGLRSLFANSVMSNVMEEIAQNERFLLDDTHGVLLSLDVDSIGGLSSKSRGDAEKGQLVSNLHSNNPIIDIVMDDDLAEAGQLVMIPTKDGLGFDGISQFRFIGANPDARFHWAIADLETQEITVTGQQTSLDVAREVAEGTLDVADVVNADDIEVADPVHSEDADDAAVEQPAGGASAYRPADGVAGQSTDQLEETAFMQPVGGEVAGIGGIAPVTGAQTGVAEASDDGDLDDGLDDEGPGDLDEDGFDAEDYDEDGGYDDAEADDAEADDTDDVPQMSFAEVDEEPASLEYDPTTVDPDEDTSATGYDPDEDQQPVSAPTFDDPEQASQMQIADTVARRLHGSQLSLRVDMAPFDTFFETTGVEGKLFSFSDDGGWLSKNVDELRHVANAELQAAFDRARESERQLWIQLVSKRIHQLQDELDVQNPATFYGRAMATIERTNRPGLGERERMVNEQKQAIQTEYERRREEYVQQIVARERGLWDQRNQPRLDGDLAKVAHDFDGLLSDRLNSEVDALQERRQAHAETELEKCETQALDVLAKVHKENLARIDSLRSEHVARMDSFVKAHREHEIAQAKVLQDEIDQAGKISSLTQDFEARFAAAKAEYETRLRAQEERIEALQADNRSQIERISAERDARIADMQRQVQTREAELAAKLAENNQVVQQRFAEAEEQVKAAAEERDAMHTKYTGAVNDALKDAELSNKRIDSLESRAQTAEAGLREANVMAETRLNKQRTTMLYGVLGATLAAGTLGWVVGHSSHANQSVPTPQPTVTQTATTTQTVTVQPQQPTVTATQPMPAPSATVTVTATPHR